MCLKQCVDLHSLLKGFQREQSPLNPGQCIDHKHRRGFHVAHPPKKSVRSAMGICSLQERVFRRYRYLEPVFSNH